MAEQILKNRLTRVAIKNFRSIAECDVALEPLTILVGPNNSGKSNFLDALRFLRDCMHDPITKAVQQRRNSGGVFRDQAGASNTAEIAVHCETDEGSYEYSLKLWRDPQGPCRVFGETCRSSGDAWFERDHKSIRWSGTTVAPNVTEDSLLLRNLSGYPEFAPLCHILSRLGFPEFDPRGFRSEDMPERDAVSGFVFDHGNLVSKIHALELERPERFERVHNFIQMIVPGLEELLLLRDESKLELKVRERSQIVDVKQMSDGTLRSLAALADAYEDAPFPVCLEEPETGLHPGAASALWDALSEASNMRQIIVATHSPDLLNRKDIPLASLVAVEKRPEGSVFGPISGVGRDLVNQRLMTAGELLRLGQMAPEEVLHK